MFVPLVKAQLHNYVDEFRLTKPLFRHVSLALLVCKHTIRNASSPTRSDFLLSQTGLFFNAFALTASNVFSFHLWRLVTNFIVETNVLLCAWSIIAAYQFVVFIVPVWGLREVLKYVVIVQVRFTIVG